MTKWTTDEDIILQSKYSLGAAKVKDLLPERTLSAIRSRAFIFGLIGKTSKGVCRKCGCVLTINNWYLSACKRFDYICKTCLVEQNKQIRRDNPKLKKWYPENTLHTNGNTYLVRKRPRPENCACELCNKITHTVYHHYGEIKHGESLLGIWVCKYCHPFVELYDRGFSEKYALIKKRILNE